MSEEAAGLVAAVSSKVLDSGTYYSFCIDDIWYRTGRDPIPFEKGHTIKFLFEDSKYGKQVDLSSLKIKEGKTVTRGGGSSTARGLSKDQYWANKEAADIERNKQIRMAGALNTAINMVTKAIELDCLTEPKGKQPARFEAFTSMVQEEADRLYEVIAAVPDRHDALMKADIGEEQSTDIGFEDLETPSPETDEWS